jgi:hypothetical protein
MIIQEIRVIKVIWDMSCTFAMGKGNPENNRNQGNLGILGIKRIKSIEVGILTNRSNLVCSIGNGNPGNKGNQGY